MPFDRKRYPANWREISEAIKAREGRRCKWCGLDDGRWIVRHPGDSAHFETFPDRATAVEWIADQEELGRFEMNSLRTIRVVLTCAHVHDPDPMNCDPANLAALCQRCHNRHDMPHRQAAAAVTRGRKNGQEPLFQVVHAS